MFIKKVDKGVGEGKKEMVWECDSYYIEDLKHKLYFKITIQNGVHSKEIVAIDTDDLKEQVIGIWAMNNEGKTIDTIFVKG